jgi:hypothetical protein
MTDLLEQLETERDARLDDIKKHRVQIELLQVHIGKLEGEVKGLNTAISIFAKNADVELDKPEEVKVSKIPSRYSLITLVPAILHVIQHYGEPPGLSASEIVDRLIHGGFKGGDNLYQSVYSVAMSQVKQGRIKEGMKEGKRSFMRSDNPNL